MSTSYDVCCLDCGPMTPDWRVPGKLVRRYERADLEDFRDGAGLERLLTLGRPSLETVGMLIKDLWQLTTASHPLAQLLEFCGRHAGHSLVVMDEYGHTMADGSVR